MLMSGAGSPRGLRPHSLPEVPMQLPTAQPKLFSLLTHAANLELEGALKRLLQSTYSILKAE